MLMFTLSMEDANKIMVYMAIALHVWIAQRVAMYAPRIGRARWKWFLISMLLTGIPFLIVYARELLAARRVSSGQKPVTQEPDPGLPASDDRIPDARCPHCGARFPAGDIDRSTGSAACPRCHMSLNEERYA